MVLRTALESLEWQLIEAWPLEIWRNTHVVLAVSAGPDSVALLRAVLSLKRAGGGEGRIFVGHLNHGVRGPAADADATWLAGLCRRLQVPLEIGRAEIAASADEQGDGWEAAARHARYQFLGELAERLGARYVATGHTADDQAETVLQRVVRGTGLAGLGGMRQARPLSPAVALIRPLIRVPRRVVLQYLAAAGQDYRTDETNVDPRFIRNRLRHELLPMLRDRFNPNVDEALRRLAVQAGEAQHVVERLARELATHCVQVVGTPPRSICIDRRPLMDQPPIVVREALKTAWSAAGWPLQAMGFVEWERLANLALGDKPMSPVNLPGEVRANRRGDEVVLESLASSSQPAVAGDACIDSEQAHEVPDLPQQG